jgi:hypothetical protein
LISPAYNIIANNVATTISPNVGTVTTYRINLRLGDILPDSFFNMNNSFYLSKVLYLRLTWNALPNILWDYQVNGLPTANCPYAINGGADPSAQINLT